MYRISVSLLTLVLLGTVGLGYSLTSFYNLLGEPGDQAVDSVVYARALGSQLAKTLDAMPERRSFIERWNEQNNYFIELVEPAQFSISAPLLQELRRNGPLALEDGKSIRFNFYLKDSDEVLVVRAPPSTVDGQAGLKIAFTVIFYIGLLLLALVWLAPLLFRLRKLRTAAMAFGEGHLETRIAKHKMSYISDIETEFNRMADQIGNLVEDVRLLSSALSHEMRTPLAKLRMGLDALEEQEDPPTRQRYLERLGRTVDQLTRLVTSTLEFSRMDFALVKAGRRRVDLVRIIHSCVEESDLTDIDIRFDAALDSATIKGNEPYLGLMLKNIIGNAAKYSSGHIILSLHPHKEIVSLSVEDDGPGFEAGASDYVFEPFQKGKAERTKAGFGLGLAVVHRIVSWHGGEITLGQSQSLKGARVTVVFKLAGECSTQSDTGCD